MDAPIVTFTDASWKPITPAAWITHDELQMANINHDAGISHNRVLHKLREGLEADLWKHASKAHDLVKQG